MNKYRYGEHDEVQSERVFGQAAATSSPLPETSGEQSLLNHSSTRQHGTGLPSCLLNLAGERGNPRTLLTRTASSRSSCRRPSGPRRPACTCDHRNPRVVRFPMWTATCTSPEPPRLTSYRRCGASSFMNVNASLPVSKAFSQLLRVCVDIPSAVTALMRPFLIRCATAFLSRQRLHATSWKATFQGSSLIACSLSKVLMSTKASANSPCTIPHHGVVTLRYTRRKSAQEVDLLRNWMDPG
ncbi:hypothetical protein QFZ98_004734 [Paraburkholderia youngii]